MKGFGSKAALIENEAYFRKLNERVGKNFAEIVELAKTYGNSDLIRVDDAALHFLCECSDEDCRERIKLRPSRYYQIHQNRRRFVTMPGHQVDAVECVVTAYKLYTIVEKRSDTPESDLKLQPTPVENS